MIELKEFNHNHFNKLISWIDNEKTLIQFAGPIFTYPLTTEQLSDYVKEKNRISFAIYYSGQLIGHSEIYKNVDKTVKFCRILIGDVSFRGNGLGKEVVKQMINYTFNKFEINSIELNVYDWNLSAISCYEKVGFVINRTKSKTTNYKNEIWTSINMTLTKANITG